MIPRPLGADAVRPPMAPPPPAPAKPPEREFDVVADERAKRAARAARTKPLRTKANFPDGLVEQIGERLAKHAECRKHPTYVEGCPACEDREAFRLFLLAGGGQAKQRRRKKGKS